MNKHRKQKNGEETTPIEHPGTLQSYIIGFMLSIILTIIPYILVQNHLFSGSILVVVILLFAFVQLFVQLFFFLHMKDEAKPRLNLLLFLSFISIILIVVVASIWIMQHLNYNMSLIRLDTEMKSGEGF